MKFYAKEIPPKDVVEVLREGKIKHTPFNKHRDHKGVYYTFELLGDESPHELETFLVLKSK